jgi:hypothetical protein
MQRTVQYKSIFSLLLYAVGIPLAYWHPYVAAGDVALATLLWIMQGLFAKPEK